MKPIRTIFDNQALLLRAAIDLYNKGKPIEADVTYGAGAIWRELPEPQQKLDIEPRESPNIPTLKFDIEPQLKEVMKSDCRELPFLNDSIGSIMFDPPLIGGHKGAGRPSMITKRGYGQFSDALALYAFFFESLKEFWRVLRSGGIVIFKCQDYIHDHRQHFAHIEIANMATSLNYRLEDLLILTTENRINRPDLKKMEHARKYHCYFWILRKPKGAKNGDQTRDGGNNSN